MKMAMTMPAAAMIRDEEPALFKGIQAGEPAALRALMARRDRWVRGIILAVTGDPDRLDDVAQQAWSAVWQRAGSLRDPSRWKAWLARLARNVAIDAGRDATRRRRITGPGDAVLDSRPAANPSPDQQAVRAEQHGLVLAAIRGLPAHYREPFVLRHVEEWSYQQIGEHLALGVNTVETRLVRARRLLREALKDKV